MNALRFSDRPARSIALPLALLVLVALLPACGSGEGRSAADGASGDGAGEFRGVVREKPSPRPAFTLPDTRGDPFSFRQATRDHLALLFFGYTHCPDICPAQMANLAAVLEELSWTERGRIQVVFLTTDPERDSPERLREWLDGFDESFIGLIGSRERVNRIMDGLGLPPAVDTRGRGEDDYRVGHAAQVVAFPPGDDIRVMYPFGTRQSDWAHDIPRLIGAARAGS